MILEHLFLASCSLLILAVAFLVVIHALNIWRDL